MSSNNLPQEYPLRNVQARFDYKLFNPNGKLSDSWLQNQYQRLSIQTTDVPLGQLPLAQLPLPLPIPSSRDSRNRKRIRNGREFPGEEGYEKESTDSGDEMLISDTDSNSQISNQGGFNSRDNSLAHPPKRRLTTSALSDISSNNLSFNQDQTTIDIQRQTNSDHNIITTGQLPRTPNVMNSPSHTPVSDFEEEQPQQLPLPSPSASPVQSVDTKTPVYDQVENQIIRIPNTQNEFLDTLIKLSGYLNERNQTHLVYKLLQNVNRSSLSSLNCLIHNSLKRDLISNFPLEITLQILSYLDHKTLLSISSVCKSWSEIINNNSIWIGLLKRDKFITDEKIIHQELSNSKELIKEWGSTTSGVKINLAETLYKKRYTIYKRWMNPTYQPKRISVPVTGHGSKVVTCLQHDDDKIVTGVDDKSIIIYSTKTGELLRVLDGHEGGVWALKYTGNTLVTGSTDRTVRVWNIKTGKCTHVFRGHTSTIRCLDIIHPAIIGKDLNGDDIIFPQFPLLVTGSRDHNINVWKLPICNEDEDDNDIDENIEERVFDSNEADNPYLITVLSGHTDSVRSVSGYGNIIISGSYDSTVRVWDLLNNGQCRYVLKGHQHKVYSTAIDFSSKTCFSGSMDSNINIWNFETGKLLKTLEGHSSLVGLLNLQDGVLVSAAADTTLRIWDPKTGESLTKLKGHTGAITCFEHDGFRVVSGSDRMLKLWDVKDGKCTRDLLTDVTGNIWQVRIDYKRCVAAVQRLADDDENETFIEILDFSEPYHKNNDNDNNNNNNNT
ncbi:F box protein, for ubiquitin dependent degradation [Scheffersomyces amazonensis]|uniref:F box protein, for ubiquitin dependent degradation n=1 Tax=Scheffersomyces amazonensis TaxID=1078765 RepID=UPI00315DE675